MSNDLGDRTRPFSDGYRAVAAVASLEDDYTVILVGSDGQVIERHHQSKRRARRLIDFAVERHFEDVLDARYDSRPRRQRGGSWIMSVSCPDGQRRVFAERRKPRVTSSRPIMSSELRFEVLSAAGFTCQYCGRSAPSVELHVDHVVPVSKGGTNDRENLAAACVDCNLGKGARIA